MKFYAHHIGDFDKATRHLSRIERSIYRDLLDLYYDTERQISLDLTSVCRLILARSNEESTAVQQVLNEFFTETPTGWYHERCEHEIALYHANTSQKALAGKASAEAKRLKKLQYLNGESTAVQQPLNSVATAGNGDSTNHKPITNNHDVTEPAADQPAAATDETEFCRQVLERYTQHWGTSPPLNFNLIRRILTLGQQYPSAQTVDWWDAYFQIARQDEFLNGTKRSGFIADLVYLLKDEVFSRVIESSQRETAHD